MSLFGYLASLLMGAVLGMMGGGGAILMVPILVYLFKLTPTIATGYSLFIVGFTALIGCISYIKRGEISFRIAVIFAIPSFAGVYLSRAFIVHELPDVIARWGTWVLTRDLLIMMSFAVIMISASFSMLRKSSARAKAEGVSGRRIFLVAGLGLIVGLIAGFVGAGGGFLIIPALVILLGLPMRTAVGTSLAIIAFQSLLGFTGELRGPHPVQWPFLMSVVALTGVGILFGSRIASHINEVQLKKAFGWFVLIMGVAILAEQLGHF